MGKKYYLTDFNINNNYNAGSKAVIDVNQILENNGYEPLFLGYGGRKGYLGKLLISLYCLIIIFLKLKKSDVVFIQYPYNFVHHQIKRICYGIISIKSGSIELLIHDLDSLRFHNVTKENNILLKAKTIICHTPNMKKYLQNLGVDNYRIKILYLFDYITNSHNTHPTSFGHNVIFAGNLGKSGFISKLHNIHKVKFLLYGLPQMEFEDNSNVRYMGKFNPNDISDIKGDWGLVWDGDSIETCDGLIGEYLAINSSHKLSLYISAQKPVIVWEKSSLKEFIINNHLGISINSLYEIDKKIEKITDSEAEQMQESLFQFSNKLKQGAMLTSIINIKDTK